MPRMVLKLTAIGRFYNFGSSNSGCWGMRLVGKNYLCNGLPEAFWDWGPL
jgi:hypothetical protein